MGGLVRDLRDSWRGLWHERGLSIAALLMMSLAVGASSVIFAVVEAVVLELPFDEPERVVTIRLRNAERDPVEIPYSQVEQWAQARDVFESVGAYALGSPILTGSDAAVRLQAELLTASMFQVLGVSPRIGRTFRDDELGVAVLSHGFWRSRFNTDADVLGRSLVLDGVPTTIIGVMPEGFDGPRSRPGDLWLPLRPSSGTTDRRSTVSVLARLAPNVDAQLAKARVEATALDSNASRVTAEVYTARQDFLYVDALDQIRLLAASVAVLMMMACVNVASLLVGRNLSRTRELALRLAVGASRWHIIRQVGVETLLLSLSGALLGLGVASWSVSALVPLVPGWFPRVAQINVDTGVMVFALALAAVTAVGVSVWPAWVASRQDLQTALKTGERGNANATRRARTVLVGFEAALGMVLVTGAALMVGAFLRLNPTDPGFELDDRWKFSVRFTGPRYGERQSRIAAVEEIARHLRAVTGVSGASSVTVVPLSGSSAVFPLRVAGAEPETGRPPTVHFRAVLPDYLTIMGMPIVAGREFSKSDSSAAHPVALVNQAFVARVLRGRDPLGAEVVIDEPDGRIVRTIVGIVRDTRMAGNDLRPRPEVFVPYAQSPLTLASFVVRVARGQNDVEGSIRQAVRAFDSTLPVDRVEALSAVAARSVNTQRLFAVLMTGFAVIAVTLCVVGLYAVASWSVTQRTREIGVRMALGASPSHVRAMILRYGAGIGIGGALTGLACAIALTRFVESYLYGFPPRQPPLLTAIAAGFAAIVMLASYLPARRAMRVDPMIALRMDI